MDLKNSLKSLWISAAGFAAFIIIELPLMYFLIGILGSNPYVFAIPAILGFIIMFCIENNFVTAEKITAKKFFIYVYLIPEFFAILLSVFCFFVFKSSTGADIGMIMRFFALLMAITIILRALSQATKLLIIKISGQS